uniref:C3H1-type domain-containing protein n=1 Tax=Alexandrium monilatum TaxID=311494 RepID=A0A7S4R113_9DINO
MSWRGTLPEEEESTLLRALAEGRRAWCGRLRDIRRLLAGLEAEAQCQWPCPEVSARMRQLRAITAGQAEDSEDRSAVLLEDAELALCGLLSPAGSRPTGAHAAGVEDAQSAEMHAAASCAAEEKSDPGPARRGEELGLGRLHELLCALDLEVDRAFDDKYGADIRLSEFEHVALTQWQERKRASELHACRYSALTGMRYAMRAALARYEWRLHLPEGLTAAETSDCVTERASASWKNGSAAGSRPHGAPGPAVVGPLTDGTDRAPALPEAGWHTAPSWEGAESRRPRDADPVSSAGGDDASTIFDGDPEATRMDSDATANSPMQDPRLREEVLKREHRGSAGHPYGCRACHVQGGMCLKGLSCSFCHICPSAKRRSTHQRVIEKQRQQRYRQVRNGLGVECLDELTKVDHSRRQIMTSCEELKRRVKGAYGSGNASEIVRAKSLVARLLTAGDVYRASVPLLLGVDGTQSRGPKEASGPPSERDQVTASQLAP